MLPKQLFHQRDVTQTPRYKLLVMAVDFLFRYVIRTIDNEMRDLVYLPYCSKIVLNNFTDCARSRHISVYVWLIENRLTY